jgi:hypothetical protein
MARLTAAPGYDRFAHWPRGAAWAALVVIAVVLAAAVWTAPGAPAHGEAAQAHSSAPAPAVRDYDLQLYDHIAQRVAAGENYYTVAVAEQRARDFPVRPGIAVRLPTLAYLTAWLGPNGLLALSLVLALGILAAWWRRLGEEPGGTDRRIVALLLLAIGSLIALKPQYLAQHEVWAGLLLALGGGLHRPGKWRAAWLPVALALAIRELALPFLLLLVALAAWRRDWREFAAWVALAVLFALGLAWHLHEVAKYLLPGDRLSPSWLVFRGLPGWTGNIVQSSVLHLLPIRLAAPLALLPLLGWAAWKTPAGRFFTLLFAGYGLLFMIAGRANNFYWALVATPAWFVGYAFLPMGLRSLMARAMDRTGTGA